MRSRAVVLFTLLTLAAACGGKIAPEGQGQGGGGSGTGNGNAGGSGSGTVDEPPPPGSFTTPAPTASPPPGSGDRPGAQCPGLPPTEGSDCGWQYGIPCDYTVARRGDTCAVQCICVGSDRSPANRWTCFDIGCNDG